MINEHQRQLIEDKYGRLIHKIGHNISGDLAISSHSDNVQDLWVSVLEAIKGFEKKEGIPFEEFWGGTPFDKYLKTCLWNSKNSKGAKITKKYPITKHTVDIVDNAEVLALEAPYSLSTESTVFMEEVAPLFTEEQQEVVFRLVEEPTYIKPSGKVNIQALAQNLNKSWYEVKNIITGISFLLNNEL